MHPRTLLVVGLFGSLTLCGCQSLSGTTWVASEIKIRSKSDPAGAAEIRALVVEFGRDGSLKTTVQRADGTLRSEDDESYEVQGDKIVIRHPNYQKRVAFQLRDDTLFVQSDEYDVTFVRYVRAAQPSPPPAPAMFRPAELRQVEYRRVSYIRR